MHACRIIRLDSTLTVLCRSIMKYNGAHIACLVHLCNVKFKLVAFPCDCRMMPSVQVSDGFFAVGVTVDSEQITNPPPQVCSVVFIAIIGYCNDMASSMSRGLYICEYSDVITIQKVQCVSHLPT